MQGKANVLCIEPYAHRIMQSVFFKAGKAWRYVGVANQKERMHIRITWTKKIKKIKGEVWVKKS